MIHWMAANITSNELLEDAGRMALILYRESTAGFAFREEAIPGKCAAGTAGWRRRRGTARMFMR